MKYSTINKTYLEKLKYIIGVIIIVFVIIVVGSKFTGASKIATSATPGSTQVDIAPALKTVNLNKIFSFPVKDSNGVTVTNIEYTLDKAELRNQIVVKGQTATAIKGRVFLILTVKLKNDSEKDIQLDTRNYLRLSENGRDWLAPDIHNDPVEAQPISTKMTQLGFPINDTDKKLKLQVGEISGQKTTLDLNF